MKQNHESKPAPGGDDAPAPEAPSSSRDGQGSSVATLELYQVLLLEHSKLPRHFTTLAAATHSASCDNPLCGDQVSLMLRVEAGQIVEIGFQGESCAIARASASMMTEQVLGLTRPQVLELNQAFSELLQGTPRRALGDLDAFAEVARYPVRVRCAELPWRALHDALQAAGAA